MKKTRTIFISLILISQQSYAIDPDKECIASSEVSREFVNLRNQGVAFETILNALPDISSAIGEELDHPEGFNETRQKNLQSMLAVIYSNPEITPDEVYQASIAGCLE
ncbi:hypothetical protein [Halovibrio sp. HP20-50]|uniref:hypothetical protein n=1 Tax=Halovibrio sp. HP20-59 TaxID=3080275 RepID=UPI00294B43B2|nr:hypothetical protein [Halovibrio sp. HP20-59]MEA2117932.1 hypothetical protein [Halovibrio sp. HP20-59]